MKWNVGGFDRLERVSHGIIFLLIALFLVNGIWKYVLGGYGAIRLLTGVFQYCPVYVPFRYSTWRKKEKDS